MHAPSTASQSSWAPRAASQRLRALVVTTDRRAVRAAEAALGADAQHVTHAAEAVRRLHNEDLDVVLVDLQLPDELGLACVTRLRDARAGMAIVVLAGADDEGLAQHALQCGAQDYLLREHMPPALVRRAARLAVEHQRMQAQLTGAAEDLRRQEHALRVTLDSLDEAVVTADIVGRVTHVNALAARALALDPSWQGQHVEELLSLRDAATEGPVTLPPPEALVAQGEVSLGDVFVERDPARRWSLRVAPLRAADGRARGMLLVLRDVSEARRGEAAERHLRADVRRVLDASRDGVGITREGRWAYANAALASLLGFATPAEMVGGEVSFPREGAMDARPLRVTRADGESALLELTTAPLDDFEGGPATLVTARDLRARERRVAQLVAADRAASIGSLAASVAHGINTPMCAVIGRATTALQRARAVRERLPWSAHKELAQDARAVCDELEAVLLHAGEVAQLTRSFGTFAQQGEGGASTRVDEVMSSVLALAHNDLRHRCRVAARIDAVPAVAASEAQVGHLLLNLLQRAARRIEPGSADAHLVTVTVATEGRDVRIDVSDTGAPEPERLDRVLDADDPSGVGLAVCRALAGAMGGAITTRGDARGTTVTVRIPRAEETPWRATDAAPVSAGAAVQRGRVLVVDDEAFLVGMISDLLSEQHDVTGLTSAREALAKMAAGERYDVVLCDLMMPSMTGVQMYEALSETAPEMCARVVFLTAGAFSQRARDLLAAAEVPWLQKPFDPERLRALVASRVAALH